VNPTGILIRLIPALLIAAILCGVSLAQGIVTGTVIDGETLRPLPGANVYLQGTVVGTVTDRDGIFRIPNIPRGTFTLVVSMIGYEQFRMPDISLERGETRRVDVRLRPAILEIAPIVVTATKIEQSLRDVPTSVSVMQAQDIERRNVFTIDEALRYIPGVHLNLSQINIRGSSGYSHGAGSRVLLLIDGVPVLAGDSGEITWEIVPTDQVERIEVVKGAGSTLYGSNALGGVVNVITRDLPDRPVSAVKVQGGYYDKPYYDAWIWSDRTRFKHHLSIAHGRRIGPLQIVGSLGTFYDDSHRQNDSRRRTTGYLKGEYILSPFQTVSLSSFFNDQTRNNFLYWKNFENALEPYEEQLGEEVKSFRIQSRVQYRHIYRSGTFLTARGSWYHTDFNDNIGETGNASKANVFGAELQFNHMISASQYLVAGIEGSVQTVNSDIFGDRVGYVIALYAQDEWTVASPVKITGGIRFDVTKLDTISTFMNVSPRAGLVYALSPSASLRASAGVGFRAPSSAEAFATTAASGLIVSPNPDLDAERSWSFETGANFTLAERITVDAALFQNEYWDMIEPVIVEVTQEGITARFVNILRARVQGFETGISSSLFGRMLQPRLGYTYVDGKDVDAGEPLKYRHKHMFTGGLLLQQGMFWAEVEYRYLSKSENIDFELGFIIDRAEERVSVHVLNFSVGVNGNFVGVPVKLSANITNALQYHYVEFPGNIAPTRLFVASLQVAI
jgi:outer membrane receptor for ferrienterochelin and colicins